VVRHGETAWSLSGQHTGTTDIPLTPRGEAVARRLQPVLASERFGLVLTSPRVRARKTCELAGLAGRAEVDEDLCEWDYGEYEGLTPQQIRSNAPRWRIFADGCPGGESPAQVGIRLDRLIARVRAIDRDVVLFAHGHIIRALAARWLDFPVIAGSHFLLDTATLSILAYYRGIPAVKRWNMTLPPERL